MSKITTLVTGAGVQTPSAQPVCDQYILVGDIDTASPLTGFTVEIDGNATINIAGSTPLVTWFSKFMTLPTNGVIGLLLKVALGKIKKGTTYRFTNGGVTTPDIFAFSNQLQPSNAPNGGAIKAATIGIELTSNRVFKSFSALALTPVANITTVDIRFKDGNMTTFGAVELDALFALTNCTDANGRFDPLVSGIDNRAGDIAEVQVNTGAAALTVLVVKLDDADFQALKF